MKAMTGTVRDGMCNLTGAVGLTSHAAPLSELPIGEPDGLTYVPAEVTNRPMSTLRPVQPPFQFHLYASKRNNVSEELLMELESTLSIKLEYTMDLNELEQCEQMLVVLHSNTWAGGRQSEYFSWEVARAVQMGVPLLLAHETPGSSGKWGHGVEFDNFYENERGATPSELLHAGIYQRIACSLKGGVLRPISLKCLADELAKPAAYHHISAGMVNETLSYMNTAITQALAKTGSAAVAVTSGSAKDLFKYSERNKTGGRTTGEAPDTQTWTKPEFFARSCRLPNASRLPPPRLSGAAAAKLSQGRHQIDRTRLSRGASLRSLIPALESSRRRPDRHNPRWRMSRPDASKPDVAASGTSETGSWESWFQKAEQELLKTLESHEAAPISRDSCLAEASAPQPQRGVQKCSSCSCLTKKSCSFSTRKMSTLERQNSNCSIVRALSAGRKMSTLERQNSNGSRLPGLKLLSRQSSTGVSRKADNKPASVPSGNGGATSLDDPMPTQANLDSVAQTANSEPLAPSAADGLAALDDLQA